MKAGTAETGCIERLFVTGVSPVTMDDVTSGFNIGTNISLLPEFNEVLGFTECEVRTMLEVYRDSGVFLEEVDPALATMRGVVRRLSLRRRRRQDVYNADMALYYLKLSIALGHPPKRLIDRNVRVDYGKLRHLLIVSRHQAEKERRSAVELNGNFDLLRQVIAEEGAECDIQDGFPLRELGKRENFLSLLHCFGLLSIRGAAESRPRLGIAQPDREALAVRHPARRLRRSGRAVGGHLRVHHLVHEMAYRGTWRPVFEHLADAVARHASIRDYMEGEKMVQGFLAAYLAATQLLSFLLGTRARRRLRGHLPGTERRGASGRATRLCVGAQVLEAKRPRGGSCGVGAWCEAAATAVSRRRGLAAAPAAGALCGRGAGVPRLATGTRRSGRGGWLMFRSSCMPRRARLDWPAEDC